MIFVSLIVCCVLFVFCEAHSYVSDRTVVVRITSAHWSLTSCPSDACTRYATNVLLQIGDEERGPFRNNNSPSKDPTWGSEAIATFDNVLESELSLRILLQYFGFPGLQIDVPLTDCQRLYENETEEETITSPDGDIVTIEVLVVCSLQDCAERIPQSTSDSCLSKAFESSGCYMQMLDGKHVLSCAKDCLNFNHTEISGEKCEFKECIDRKVNTSAGVSYPCGEFNCYQQMNEGVNIDQCAKSCPDTDHTEKNDEAGICQLRVCDKRRVRADTQFPCGAQPCYLETDGVTCAFECLEKHTEANATAGICEYMDCALRAYDMGAALPCGGQGCFFDPAAPAEPGKQCVDGCADDGHHKGTNTQGACELKDCALRANNASALYPCGDSACFLQPSGTDPACDVTCPESHHNDQHSVCVKNADPNNNPDNDKSPKGNTNLPVIIGASAGGAVLVAVVVVVVIIVVRRKKSSSDGTGTSTGASADAGKDAKKEDKGSHILLTETEASEGVAAEAEHAGAGAGAGGDSNKQLPPESGGVSLFSQIYATPSGQPDDNDG